MTSLEFTCSSIYIPSCQVYQRLQHDLALPPIGGLTSISPSSTKSHLEGASDLVLLQQEAGRHMEGPPTMLLHPLDVGHAQRPGERAPFTSQSPFDLVKDLTWSSYPAGHVNIQHHLYAVILYTCTLYMQHHVTVRVL